MTAAFQANAFQNNAFQVNGGVSGPWMSTVSDAGTFGLSFTDALAGGASSGDTSTGLTPSDASTGSVSSGDAGAGNVTGDDV